MVRHKLLYSVILKLHTIPWKPDAASWSFIVVYFWLGEKAFKFTATR